jgi:hypothetical protein
VTETLSQYAIRKNEEFWKALNTPVSGSAHPRKKRKKSEARVQHDIVKWLCARGVILAVTDAGALHRMGIEASCGIPKGWPDLTCLFPGGRFVGIECKAKRGTQSNAQKIFEQAIQKNGGLYILAHDRAELIEALREQIILGHLNDFPLDD